MKLSALHQSYNRDSSIPWLLFHFLCCLISLVLGFRFSRLLFFLLLSSSTPTSPLYPPDHLAQQTLTLQPPSNRTLFSSKVVVGRHGILVRPWPHPNPIEVMKAHRIINRVQTEQRVQYGVRNPRTVIAITPTYVRTFQALHLSGVMHSLMNVGYDVVWLVVEAGGTTTETASLVAQSGLRVVHVGFDERMPSSWEERLKVEDRMRIRGLRWAIFGSILPFHVACICLRLFLL